MAQPALSLVSWNIHRGRGNDGQFDPGRTLDVLRDEVWAPGTDILWLQEADGDGPPHRGLLDLDRLTQDTGLRHAHDSHSRRWGAESHGFLGVILFVHPSITIEDMALLDLPGHCHRGAVVVEARRDSLRFRLVGVHLSLSQMLRAAQLRTLGQHLTRRPARQTILCGDLNEWRPWGGLALSPRIIGHRFSGPAIRSFPVRWPMLPLDRVLTTAPGQVQDLRALDGPGLRMASDHRPVAARVTLG